MTEQQENYIRSAIVNLESLASLNPVMFAHPLFRIALAQLGWVFDPPEEEDEA